MILVGTSGWRYKEWRNDFYPRGLAQRRELEFASKAFDSIEINGSFYSLLQPPAVRRWVTETPDDFVFAVKGSRFISHMKKLRNVEIPLANFFASGVLALGEKLGPILWQLPPQTHFDPEVLARFFDLLPRTTNAASGLARKHDGRVRPRAHLKALADMPIRYALEIRHPSFETPRFRELLRAYDIALCIADTAGHFPLIEAVTTRRDTRHTTRVPAARW